MSAVEDNAAEAANMVALFADTERHNARLATELAHALSDRDDWRLSAEEAEGRYTDAVLTLAEYAHRIAALEAQLVAAQAAQYTAQAQASHR